MPLAHDAHPTRARARGGHACGLEGYDETTRDGEGKVIRSVRRFDSALLQQQLKRRRPEAYRDNAGIALTTPAVFVLDSAFGRAIEAPAVEPVLELPASDVEEVNEGDA